MFQPNPSFYHPFLQRYVMHQWKDIKKPAEKEGSITGVVLLAAGSVGQG